MAPFKGREPGDRKDGWYAGSGRVFLQREQERGLFLRERPLLEEIVKRRRDPWQDDILHALVVMGMRERGWKMMEEIYGKRDERRRLGEDEVG